MNDCKASIVIVGAGINGMLTARLLRYCGARITLYDSGGIPCTHSASYGLHRLIHPFGSNSRYAKKSLILWQDILSELNCEGFIKTGVITNGTENGTEISSEQADYYMLGANRAGPVSVDYRFGVLFAKRILNALANSLVDAGVNLQPYRRVASIDPSNACITFTSGGIQPESYDHVVVAAGPGTALICGLQSVVDKFHPQRSYVLCLPAKNIPTKIAPKIAWTNLLGKDLWGMPAINHFPAKFGFGDVSHCDYNQTVKDADEVIARFIDAYTQIDPRYTCLSDAQVASNVYALCPDESLAVTSEHCTTITSDNGMGFKYSPLAAQEASRQVQNVLSVCQLQMTSIE